MVPSEGPVAVQGPFLMVIRHVMEQETFSGFVIVAGVLVVEKWSVNGLPFQGTELWLVRGNLESLARREVPKANRFQGAERADTLRTGDLRSTALRTSTVCGLERLLLLLGSVSMKPSFPVDSLDSSDHDIPDDVLIECKLAFAFLSILRRLFSPWDAAHVSREEKTLLWQLNPFLHLTKHFVRLGATPSGSLWATFPSGS
jgi:hypothetical protein